MWLKSRASVPLLALVLLACGSETEDPPSSGATSGSGGMPFGTDGAGGTSSSTASVSGSSNTGSSGKGGATSATAGATTGITATTGVTATSGATATTGVTVTTGATVTSTATTTGSTATSSTTGGGGTVCPGAGKIKYTLVKAAAPTADQQAAYDKIIPAMDKAVEIYNCNTDIAKSLSITYVPTVQTADGNTNGSIRFGSKDSMNYITAMHEISHSVGIGGNEYNGLIKSGVFTGTMATAQLRAITGNAQDVVHGDTQHFWPYGLNYTTEVMSPTDLLSHCKMVVAIRADSGL